MGVMTPLELESNGLARKTNEQGIRLNAGVHSGSSIREMHGILYMTALYAL
jgi:hypothetical protein